MIVETNTYYKGDRYTTEQHRKTLEVNDWTFCPMDIMGIRKAGAGRSIESRHGLRQLSYMKELGMGNNRYILIDLDNGGKRITAAEAVMELKPFIQNK